MMHACACSDQYREAEEDLQEALGHLKRAYPSQLAGHEGADMRRVLSLLRSSGNVPSSACDCLCTDKQSKEKHRTNEASVEYMHQKFEGAESAVIRKEMAIVGDEGKHEDA